MENEANQDISARTASSEALNIASIARAFLVISQNEDLTFSAIAALLLVGAAKEVRIGLLATHLRMSLPGTSRLVDGLVERGLVDRRESAENRSSRVLQLTEAGLQLTGHIDTQVQARARVPAWPDRNPTPDD